MPAPNQANILWIMTDQHQAACLGCMDNPHIQTPNLDRLAGEGVLFRNAFCQSPVCMASRASLFTGRYPEAIRVRGMGVLPPSETTLPELLWRNGYHTGAFGKVHLTPERYTIRKLGSEVPILDWHRFAEDAKLAPIADDPFKRDYGFETHVGCDDACQGNFQAWLREVAPELAEQGRPEPVPGGPRDLFVSPYPSEFHPSTYIASQAANYIRSQNGSSPWFTFCSFVAPHHPFEAPADQIARYDLDAMPLPPAKGGVDMRNPPPRLAEAIGDMDRFPEEIQRRIVQHYYASISLVDDCVGTLLDTLEATGQRDNTIVLFVADHGEFAGNHGLLRKPSFHYDDVMRVPLIMNLPGRGAWNGRRIDGLVELVDVYPTLLGRVGLPVNAGVQGRDWSGALQTGDGIGREDIYSDMYEMDPMVCEQGSGPYAAIQTLRTEAWKLSVYPRATLDCGMLFDLKNDPDETQNLFHDPAHRARREALLWRMLQRVHANTDPLPLRLTQW